MFRTHFYKLLRSPSFYAAFLMVLGLSLFSRVEQGYGNISSNISGLMMFMSYRKMYVIAAALPFTANFANEWNSGAITNCITRKSVIDYARSNVVVCYISSFVMVFAGMMGFVFIMSARMPMYNYDDLVNLGSTYDIVAANGLPLLALTLTIFIFASSCAMCSVLGITASAFIPNKYVALCAPFVFSYLIERLSTFLPERFSYRVLAYSCIVDDPIFVFLWSNFVFIAVSAICGVIFTIAVRRRVENELS